MGGHPTMAAHPQPSGTPTTSHNSLPCCFCGETAGGREGALQSASESAGVGGILQMAQVQVQALGCDGEPHRCTRAPD